MAWRHPTAIRRTLGFAIGGLLTLGLAGLIALKTVRNSTPLLRIVRTALPSCRSLTYSLTQSELTVVDEERILSRIPLDEASPQALLQTVRDAAIEDLETRYCNPNVEDGFKLRFEFALPSKSGCFEVENRYVPQLFDIIDVYNKHLPPSLHFTEKLQLVGLNQQLDGLISRYTLDTAVEPAWRDRIPEQLRSQKVDTGD